MELDKICHAEIRRPAGDHVTRRLFISSECSALIWTESWVVIELSSVVLASAWIAERFLGKHINSNGQLHQSFFSADAQPILAARQKQTV
jgi:hypothetical protein